LKEVSAVKPVNNLEKEIVTLQEKITVGGQEEAKCKKTVKALEEKEKQCHSKVSTLTEQVSTSNKFKNSTIESN